MIAAEPNYVAAQLEVEAITAAYGTGLPVMLTGPTGCGKTRLVHHVAARLGLPMITVVCHDDLTSSDLVGRFLVVGGDVRWTDGPLTRAVRTAALCYLDEVAEARRDTLAVLHSLADDRRQLYLERTGEVVDAPPEFLLIGSYNPKSKSLLKELKPSFRQRFVTIDLDYLPLDSEAEVVHMESGVDKAVALHLCQIAGAIRTSDAGGAEQPSTRLLVNTARLIQAGVPEATAVETGLIAPLSLGEAVADAVRELLRSAGLAH